MDTYVELKDLLRTKGWIEQRDGEVYLNGEFGTNFGKDGTIIHLSYNEWVDEEEWADLFQETTTEL